MGLPVAVRSWSVAAQRKNARGDTGQPPRCTSSLSRRALAGGFFVLSVSGLNAETNAPHVVRVVGLLVLLGGGWSTTTSTFSGVPDQAYHPPARMPRRDSAGGSNTRRAVAD